MGNTSHKTNFVLDHRPLRNLSKSISDAGSEVKHAPVSGVKGKLFLVALGQSFVGEGQW